MTKGIFIHLVSIVLYVLAVMWVVDGIKIDAGSKMLILWFGLIVEWLVGGLLAIACEGKPYKEPLIKK